MPFLSHRGFRHDHAGNWGDHELPDLQGVFQEKGKLASIKSPASITQNAVYKQLEEIDARIESLQDTLKMEQDRYIKQFTALESVIAQMNSQSSWLSQFGSGY